MNLLVLPGGGNPDTSPLYSKVYAVIAREATGSKFKFGEVFTDIRWPGHTSGEKYATATSVTLLGAVEEAKKRILTLPEAPFAILGRSFGCAVALKLARQGFPSGRIPEKITLWGPSPFWLTWQMFARDLEANQATFRRKGIKIDESFIATAEPVESLIQTVAIPTVVAAGADDIYCPPAYVEYLRCLTAGNQHVAIRKPVTGAGHEVTDDSGASVVKEYAEALFGA